MPKFKSHLARFVSKRRAAYHNIPRWQWEDEGLPYAIMDYCSSYELSPQDIEYMNAHGFYTEDILIN